MSHDQSRNARGLIMGDHEGDVIDDRRSRSQDLVNHAGTDPDTLVCQQGREDWLPLAARVGL